ncbi:MAG: aspartate carbamoyltransferase catalytic subunit [Pseudomonadota bacterium]
MSRRHLLDIESLSDRDIHTLINRARALKSGAPPEVLTGSVANLFFEPSTRTRVSFELAAHRLGLQAVNIESKTSSATKGESLIDSALTLTAMGLRALVVRHPLAGSVQDLADALVDWPIAVINAGDGAHQHPSQALLDAAVLAESGLHWPELRIAILGDIAHSRVARSGIELFNRLGMAEIRIAGPADWMPHDGLQHTVTVCDSVDEATSGVDVVMCLRIQRERMAETECPDQAAFHAEWGLTEARFAGLPRHVHILHPGPINRGIEIAGAVADHARSCIIKQVEMGVYLRMAVFEWLLQPVLD